MAGLDASDGQAQGLRSMKLGEVDGRTPAGALRRAEAAAVPGVSERSFRRWRDRYEAGGKADKDKPGRGRFSSPASR